MTKRAVFTPLVLLVAIALSACAGRLNGVVDYDHEFDFASVRKLGFYEDVKPLERRQTATRATVRSEITEQLTARGYQFVDGDDAQLLIIYHGGRHAKIQVGGGSRVRGEEATLAIEFREPTNGRTAWYGTVEQTWKEGLDVDERVKSAVTMLLDSFPPKPRPNELIAVDQAEERDE